MYNIGATSCCIGWLSINRVVLDILVAHGGRVNDADEKGDTALHILTRWQGKWLRKSQASRGIYDKQMNTYNTMVTYWQEIGGSTDQRNKAGKVPAAIG